MVTPIDFEGHSSKVEVTMGIIDKSGVRGDATLCVVIFFLFNTMRYILCTMYAYFGNFSYTNF